MDPNPANGRLLEAVIEPRKHGAMQQIEEACAAGADPNGICPETSSSRGRVRGGTTLLTHAVHEGAARAVERLLACGADPNRADQLGWTPWMASTLTDESKREQIQSLLLAHGAQKAGESIGELVRAVYAGDLERAGSLIESEQDFRLLATFRVDLVQRMISNHQTEMLELLIRHGLKPDHGYLRWAVHSRYQEGVDLFLRHGAPVADDDTQETLLMIAAANGELEIVKRLVAAGADVNRYAWDQPEWTAAFRARQSGHGEIAYWLTAHMDPALLEEIRRIREGRDPKYQPLYDHAIGNDELTTDDIVEILTQWDARYGIGLHTAGDHRVTVTLRSLPQDLDAFYGELTGLCPDLCENKRAVLRELRERRRVNLWWD